VNKKLIEKYLAGECNEAEFNKVLKYFLNEKNKPEALNDIETSWYDYASAEEFKNHRLINIKTILNRNFNKNQRFISSRQALKIAASLLLIAFLGIGAYHFSAIEKNDTVAVIQQPQIIIKENPKGQKLKISLKDGSTIMLNAESSIEYDTGFGIENRNIKLKGEAFFEVAKNPKMPFSVKTGAIEVVALGTSFNVQTYKETMVDKVALSTGKVKISSVSNKIIVLEPGTMVQYKNNQFSKKSNFDPLEELGWKDGVLVFKNSSLSQVVQKLERWYGVEITVLNSDQQVNWSYTGNFNNVSLENVLNGISFTKGISFDINGEKVKINL
jgi:transmembrane sensor